MGAGNQSSQNQRVEGEISIVQSIQLGFLLSLGSVTSNEANKSAMWRAEWTITVRQAVLSLAQIKYQYFDPERCKAEHNFFRYKPSKQVISWQFIDKPMIYCWLTAQALQQLGDRGSFQDNFAQKEGPDSKFSEQHFFLLCVKADFNVLLQQCRDCPHCKITSVELAIHSLSIKLDHFKSKRIIHQSQFYAC